MPAQLLTDEWIREQIELCERVKADPTTWLEVAVGVHKGYPVVLKELQDLRASFALYTKATQAARQLYIEAHPELGELSDSDTGKMVAWLVGELQRVRKEVSDASTE